jgi:hypothetical protein
VTASSIDQDKIYTTSNAGNPYACIQRLEISFTDSLSKIQNSQDFNTTKILEAVTEVENLVKRNSNLLKRLPALLVVYILSWSINH